MPAIREFQPLRQETIATIRARIDSNVNAGLATADPRWQETTPGGFFYDHTQVVGLELENLWDFASTELPASFFLPFSWGIYLDYWGELLERPRKKPVAATGAVSITNHSAEPQTIASGLEVAAPAVTPEAEPLTYQTTESVTVGAGATAEVPVQATETGVAYDVAVNAVSLITSPSQELTVINLDPITGGEDEELDEPYKARLLLEFQGSRGGGTRDDYVAEALALPSVGNVVVNPHWAGPNTVRLIISSARNEPLSAGVVEAVKDYFDPPTESGLGAGAAPIDAEVTVATVATDTIAIAAELELEVGFTLLGVGGTVNITEAVTLALTTYFHSLTAGHDVQLSRILAAIIGIDGVYDVKAGSLLLNGSAADVELTALQSAQLGVVTLTSKPAAP